MSIYFHAEDVETPSIKQKKTESWIESTIQTEEKLSGEINFIFCSDDYLLEINKQYLQHDYYTDVITFDYTENNIIGGDIFISIDRIKENAEEFGKDETEELHRIIIHGVLHLIGYKDKSDKEKQVMTEKEDCYLSQLED